MKKLNVVLLVLLMSITQLSAFTWDDCVEKYQKAKQFSENTRLMYNYLKSTKNCLVKFKQSLIQTPNPEFKVEAMNDNIVMLDNYINELLPKYSYPKNHLEQVPLYTNLDTKPKTNKIYHYFKRYKNCNGVHANDKIYTAKHCNIENSQNVHYDLNYIKAKSHSKLQISKIDLTSKGVFKYYSMSKEGEFFKVLLTEKDCKFYKAKSEPTGMNTTLDLTDISKQEEIRSTCLAIPSNSGGGVFQKGKLVGIISKTVFDNNTFMYSVVEPIIPLSNSDY